MSLHRTGYCGLHCNGLYARTLGTASSPIFDIDEKDAQATWQPRMVYLDSRGSFPLIQEDELHDVKGASEYGLPPLRFSTLESKAGWYHKVGILRLRIQNELMRKIKAHAYTDKPGVAHSKGHGFYLFDMSTLLDLGIDLSRRAP